MTRLDDAVRGDVRRLYEELPYPAPVADLAAFRAGRRTVDGSPRYYEALLWPEGRPRTELDVLVAGCGTSQAAKLAIQSPESRFTGIDLSAASLDATRVHVERERLDNLELHRLPIERVDELGRTFDLVISTGVLHHLPDPDAGLRALRNVLRVDGAMYLMVYARYGRLGIAMLQDYCRDIGVTTDGADLDSLMTLVAGLPPGHPIHAYAARAQDLSNRNGVADALLHPQEWTYTASGVHEWLERCGLVFGRWFLQAPYSARCGCIASSPHAQRLRELGPREEHAAVELLRGTLITHALTARHGDAPDVPVVDFEAPGWETWTPVNFNGVTVDQATLPVGAVAVLRHSCHVDDDLGFPLTAAEATIYQQIDGRRTMRDLVAATGAGADDVRSLFAKLWTHDLILVRVPRF